MVTGRKMKREIKFRYRYTNGKNWIFQSFTLEQIINGEPFNVLSDNPMLKSYKYDGEDQYTGLKDKNGKEIYEGDIYQVALNRKYLVRWCDWEQADYEYHGGCFVLEFNKDMFFPFDEFAISSGKIIGNIYENPELL